MDNQDLKNRIDEYESHIDSLNDKVNFLKLIEIQY